MINLKGKENYICITVYIQYLITKKGTFKDGIIIKKKTINFLDGSIDEVSDEVLWQILGLL